MAGNSFAIYYNDRERSFLRAARTWQEKNAQGTFTLIGFSYAYELLNAFKLLKIKADEDKSSFIVGALFIHSSPPLEGAPDNSQKRGVNAAILQPTTLAELRYKEEILTPQGLGVDTVSISMLKKIDPLPWEQGGELWINGCLSGDAPPGKRSIAEVFANTQKVRTYGQLGKAYFSSVYGQYKEVTSADSSVYLRSYMRPKNMVLAALGNPLAMPGRPIPEKKFEPDSDDKWDQKCFG